MQKRLLVLLTILATSSCESSNSDARDPDAASTDAAVADANSNTSDAKAADVDASVVGCVPGGWSAMTVRDEGGVGFGSRIAVGDDGVVHITYIQGNFLENRYVYFKDGTWYEETIGDRASNSTNEGSSLVLGPDGHPHATYVIKDTNYLGRLSYGVRTGPNSWETVVVDPERTVETPSSMAMDASGGLHIAYRDATSRKLRYAYKPMGGEWATELVGEGLSIGVPISLALDSDGALHIAYSDYLTSRLKHAYRENPGADWTIESVDEDGYTRFQVSMVIDPAGGVHIAYPANVSGIVMLRYAYRASTGGSWVVEPVDSRDQTGEYAAIALGLGGAIHIAYYDSSSDDLVHAYRAHANSDWIIDPVDADGDMGRYLSLAVDTAGIVHISYYDGTPSGGGSREDLRYAVSTECE